MLPKIMYAYLKCELLILGNDSPFFLLNVIIFVFEGPRDWNFPRNGKEAGSDGKCEQVNSGLLIPMVCHEVTSLSTVLRRYSRCTCPSVSVAPRRISSLIEALL